jgi:hypothetical protein
MQKWKNWQRKKAIKIGNFCQGWFALLFKISHKDAKKTGNESFMTFASLCD